ncbi:DUF2560 family protein [Klebsiella quasipneumoniae]|uniref:DUF2560 family protein n=1 Tax=Klebsiella quasipneumoniae TaxID=1463165 RepID=UPI003F8D31FE
MDSVHHIWCPLSSQEYQDLPDGAETTLTLFIQQYSRVTTETEVVAKTMKAVQEATEALPLFDTGAEQSS